MTTKNQEATVQTTAEGIWHKVRLQHVTVLCALGVAAAVAVSTTGNAPTERPGVSPQLLTLGSPVAESREAQRLVYILVKSADQAVQVAAEMEPGSAGLARSSGDPVVHLLVVTSPAEEERALALVKEASMELMPVGAGVEVVDMRRH